MRILAMATRCFCPPESIYGYFFFKPFQKKHLHKTRDLFFSFAFSQYRFRRFLQQSCLETMHNLEINNRFFSSERQVNMFSRIKQHFAIQHNLPVSGLSIPAIHRSVRLFHNRFPQEQQKIHSLPQSHIQGKSFYFFLIFTERDILFPPNCIFHLLSVYKIHKQD